MAKGDRKESKGYLLFDFLQGIPGYFSNTTFHIVVLLTLLLPSFFVFLVVLNSPKHSSTGTPDPMVVKAMLTEWEKDPSDKENDNQIRAGSKLAEGKQYTLNSGFVELLFFGDARVIIHGPATFVAKSHHVVQLESGRCVAHVPPMASGFTIEANGSRIVDLGTEFGVETDDDMDTDVYVFQGKVELALEDAPQDSKIELVAKEGVCSSAKTGKITPKQIDTNRFIRSLTAKSVLGSLPIKNASFEEPSLAGENWTRSDGTLRSVPIPYWHVSAAPSQQGSTKKRGALENPDIGFYLWSSAHGTRDKSGVTDGNQACLLTLRDGTKENTEASETAWVYYSFGRIRPQDVGHSLELSADCFAKTPRAQNGAQITLAFATKASPQNSGTFVGKVGTASGMDAWGRPQTVHASFVMPIDLVGRELFVVIKVEDDSPGSGEDVYLIDNLELEHFHPR